MASSQRLFALTRNWAAWFCLSMAIFVASCDTLESDAIEGQWEIELKGDPIVVLPNNSGIIDLNSLVASSNGNITFSVTTLPHLGTLQSIDEFLLRYTPNENVTEGEDSFVLSVIGKENIVISEDTVVIIIVPDSTHLPCGLYAIDDYWMMPDNTGVSVNVLANDAVCDVDPSLLVVTLLDQEVNDPSSVGARYGSTKVLSNGAIRYTPNSTFQDQDRFMYKITKPANVPRAGDPLEVSIATVYIRKLLDTTCVMVPVAAPDTFEIPFHEIVQVDSVTHDTTYNRGPFYLHVTSNDLWCADQFPTLDIVRPAEGQLEESNDGLGFDYTLPDSVGAGYSDNFRYWVCAGGGCDQEEVIIIITW